MQPLKSAEEPVKVEKTRAERGAIIGTRRIPADGRRENDKNKLFRPGQTCFKNPMMNFIFIKRHHIIRKGEINNVLSTEGTAIQIIYLSKSKTDVIHK